MSTSPILAAVANPAPFQSLANPSLKASADNSDFHQVLQQCGPAVASFKALPDAATAEGTAAVARNFSTLASTDATTGAATGTNSPETADAAETNYPASLITNRQHPGATNTLLSIKANKEKTTSKSVSVNAKQLAKEVSAMGNQKSTRAKSDAVLPNAALPTPAELSMYPNLAESAAKVQPSGGTNQSTIPVDQLTASTSESVATIAAVDLTHCTATLSAEAVANPSNSAAFSPAASVDRNAAPTGEFSATGSSGHPMVRFASSVTEPTLMPEPTTRAAFSSATASASSMISAKSKAKPQATISSGKAESVAGPATSYDAVPESRTSPRIPNSHPAAENTVESNPSVDDSVLRTSNADSAVSPAMVRSQAASQSPSANNIASVSSTRDASLSIASAVSTHTPGFQLAAVQLTREAATPAPNLDAAASGAQSTAQSALVSAIFAQPLQHCAVASAPPEPQMPANAVPATPLSADSGQLRVTAAGGELKISVQLPELGKIEVRAVTAHDVTTAHLTAFRHDTLPVLAAERTGLEQALKSRDVILGSLDSHAQNSHAQDQSTGEQRPQTSPSARPSNGTSSNATIATASATTEAGNAGFLPDYSSISVRA